MTTLKPDQIIELHSQFEAPETTIRLYTVPEDPGILSFEIVHGGWISSSSIPFERLKVLLENYIAPSRP